MSWYCIRTLPGAQKPQREYAVERAAPGKDGKTRGRGYRIVPSLNPNKSAVERALEDAGVEYYMPAERRLIRDRRRPYLWKSRRFALIVGYVFVRDPDFTKLYSVPGVAGVVGSNGEPMAIDFIDMLRVFDAEQRELRKFQDDARSSRQQLRKLAKKDSAIQMIVDKLDIEGTITAKVEEVATAA